MNKSAFKLENTMKYPTLAYVLAVICGFILSTHPVFAQTLAQDIATITVTGVGKSSTEPNMAELEVSVTIHDTQATTAMNQASTIGKSLLHVAQKNKISKWDMQTGNIALSPTYTRPKDNTPPKINGYQASITKHFKIRKLAILGSFIDDLIKAGATRFSGIRFSHSDQKSLLKQARINAMKNAKSTANLLALQSGAKRGPVIRIIETAVPSPQPRRMMALAAGGGVPVVPGKISVTATVNVTYALLTGVFRVK
ncbi:MAG: hypothetical protein COB59_04140 [Rhodospirillaceae bacterium]|nr:MAG: hypothetical protein COB59_04140 [Rhodospirillaceae bacterium]